jgi:uncharacterized membrane protein
MTDRQLIAYGLMVLLAAALAAVVWWTRYNSHSQTSARRQAKRSKESASRALHLLSKADDEDRP